MMAVDMKRLNEARVSRRSQALLAGAGGDSEIRRWAIVRVEGGRENDVDNLMARAMIEHWLPLRRAETNACGRRRKAAGTPVWMLAWPGYVFVKIVDTAEAWHEIRSVRHVRKVLGIGEYPFFMSESKFMMVKAELATLKPSNGPETLFVDGEKVIVKAGPFASFPATVIEVDQGCERERALVEVMIFGRAVPVELDLAHIAKR